MTLRLIYRSYGGENMKSRPSYYSKTLTLLSFVRAACAVPDAELVFSNDGPVPAPRLAIMERYGRVHQLEETAQGMRYSYRAALEEAARSSWPDEDVVCFVEDDYLFTEGAFQALADAAELLPQASYFSLYGDRVGGGDADGSLGETDHSLPRDWRPAPDHVVNGRTWFNRDSITSTFGARLGALRSDLDIFLQCMRPFRKRYLDQETCLLYQAVVPYHGRELFFGLAGDYVPGARGLVRAAALVPFRLLINRRARRQREAHLLYTVTPNLSTHVEHPLISPDQDWEAVAADTVTWAEQQGLPTPAPIESHRAEAA